MRMIDKDELARRLHTGMNIIEVMQTIVDMPTIGERKTGKWIYGEDSCGQDGWFCSECRFFVPWYYGYNKDIDFIRAYKTCPCCDAKMISYTGKDEENATD